MTAFAFAHSTALPHSSLPCSQSCARYLTCAAAGALCALGVSACAPGSDRFNWANLNLSNPGFVCFNDDSPSC